MCRNSRAAQNEQKMVPFLSSSFSFPIFNYILTLFPACIMFPVWYKRGGVGQKQRETVARHFISLFSGLQQNASKKSSVIT